MASSLPCPARSLSGKFLTLGPIWIANYLDVVEFIILVTLESVVHMAHRLARLVPECDQGVLYNIH